MRTGRAVSISVFPLLSLMRKENLGEPHAVFAGGERYVSPRFAAQAEQVLQQELAEAGLGDRRDYLEFVDLVTVVQQATVEYYGWVTAVDEDYSVLVASHGRRAVLLGAVRGAACGSSVATAGPDGRRAAGAAA